MFRKRLLVVDLETTGLDPQRDSIVQIAALVLSRGSLKEQASFSTLVAPDTPLHPSAQRIHGLSAEQLEDAPPLSAALEGLEGLADPDDVVLCGHNVAFDAAFLRAAFARVGRRHPYDYHTVDLWSVAFFLFSANGVKARDYRLDTLAGIYGIRRDRQHDALQDVRVTAAILRHLYRAALDSHLRLSGQVPLFGEHDAV